MFPLNKVKLLINAYMLMLHTYTYSIKFVNPEALESAPMKSILHSYWSPHPIK